MRLRTEFFWSIGVLVALNAVLAFGAIGLITRMSPAIERIIEENVYSNEAAERMLAILIEARNAGDPEGVRRIFADALSRARTNITEPEEVPVLDRVARHAEAALTGDRDALGSIVVALEELVAINRRAMQLADASAQRLGAAGAWAAVLIGLISFSLSAVVAYRLERRVIDPLLHVHDVLTAVRAGDRYRRCRPFASSADVRRVLESINVILDRQTGGGTPRTEAAARTREEAERSALLELLDERAKPTVVVDAGGTIVAANQRSLELLGGADGEALRADLRDPGAVHHRTALVSRPLRHKSGWLCMLAEG